MLLRDMHNNSMVIYGGEKFNGRLSSKYFWLLIEPNFYFLLFLSKYNTLGVFSITPLW